MWIKTILGWREFPVYAEPASDDPMYRGEHKPVRNIIDRWADRENLARMEANQRGQHV